MADAVPIPYRDVDTRQDGVRRFFAWRDYIVGVLDTGDGPLGIFVRLKGSGLPAGAGGLDGGSSYPDSSYPGVPGFSPPPAPGQADGVVRPEVRLLPLGAAGGAGRPRPPAPALIEPIVVQGLALLAVGPRLLAVDLFAENLVAVPVLEFGGGEVFVSGIYPRNDPMPNGDGSHGPHREGELLAVLRTADGKPQIITLHPAVNAEGVLCLNQEWSWKVSPSDAADELFDGAEPADVARAVFISGSVVVPGRTGVWVAVSTPYPRAAAGAGYSGGPGAGEGAGDGASRWVWSRKQDAAVCRSFAEPRYACAWGGTPATGHRRASCSRGTTTRNPCGCSSAPTPAAGSPTAGIWSRKWWSRADGSTP